MAEEVKRKRGRPRKNKLPEEIQTLVDKVQEKSIPKVDIIKANTQTTDWDVPLTESILFFDPTLSYELTGYKPITDTKGLDFDPNGFLEARNTFNRTGQYCEAPFGSKAFNDFWTKQFEYCKNGITINGYTITGDHYFFLNYYRLPNLKTIKAGSGRSIDFPDFYVAQYEWFHYLEMCKLLRKNAALMKARGLEPSPAIQ